MDANIEFVKVTELDTGQNIRAIHQDFILPDFYWWLKIGPYEEGVTDFGLWEQHHLIASEAGLRCLRENEVVYAESEEIEISIEQYFLDKKAAFFKKYNIKK